MWQYTQPYNYDPRYHFCSNEEGKGVSIIGHKIDYSTYSKCFRKGYRLYQNGTTFGFSSSLQIMPVEFTSW